LCVTILKILLGVPPNLQNVGMLKTFRLLLFFNHTKKENIFIAPLNLSSGVY
jgi:hypothetical protein